MRLSTPVLAFTYVMHLSSISYAQPLTIATHPSNDLLAVQIQQAVEVAILNAGYQVQFMPFEHAQTLLQSNAGEIDGELYRYGYTMKEQDNLLVIPVSLKRSALYAYVPEDRTCPDFAKLMDFKPIGIAGITYFNALFQLSQVGYAQYPTIMSAFEALYEQHNNFSVFPKDIMPAMMQLTGIKVKSCYSHPVMELHAYTYLHKKHADKIPAITRELKLLLSGH